MVDGFYGLRHHTVVGGDNEDSDIRYLSSAGAHFGKGFVTGGIEESDFPSGNFNLISTDMLGDPAGFSRRHIGIADGVEEGGFTVVNMTHNRNDRGSFHEGAFIIFFIHEDFHFIVNFDFNGNTEFFP